MDPLLREQDLLLFSRGLELDGELRRQNWPMAVLVARGFGVEEWNLGPKDQRRPSPYAPGVDQFRIWRTPIVRLEAVRANETLSRNPSGLNSSHVSDLNSGLVRIV